MKIFITPFVLSALFLSSCHKKETPQAPSTPETEGTTTDITTTEAPKAASIIFQVQDVTAIEATSLLIFYDAPQVIDIRTAAEFASGHIPGAIQIDFMGPDFKAKLTELDRSKEYLFHCKSGGRSTQSLDIWKELGFGKIYHLNKGILSWKKAGNPTE